MTDADKVFALTELLNDVIHTLEMKQYDIEDADLSYECVTDADKFHQKMIDILYPKGEEDTCFGVHLTDEECDKLDAYLDTLN
jgi:hypothetical protein